MKVALVCPTLGQTQRGYERFMGDLHQVLGDQAQLFKGAGDGDAGATVVRHLSRTGWLARLFGTRLAYRRYQIEHASFALMLAPHLRCGGFDVVHIIDPPLAAHLVRLRRWLRLTFKLVFTHGGPAAVQLSPDIDHVHCLTEEAAQQMRASGVDAARVSVLPVGIWRERFLPTLSRHALRDQWGLPHDQFVALCVGAVNRHHKRIDHLIAEVAAGPSDLLLWLDGSLHPDGDVALLDLARERLGERFRHTQVPSDRVGELFCMADLLVSTAVAESFGMAVVEAMSVGMPVVVHDSPHFSTLLGDGAHRVDMAQPGALATFLRALRSGHTALRPAQDPQSAVARFAWQLLRPAYIGMYSRLCAPVAGRLNPL